MPKAVLFKLVIPACLAGLVHGSSLAQATLGEIIETTKRNKADQLQGKPTGTQPAGMPLPDAINLPPASKPTNRSAAPKAKAPDPVVWSIHGVNEQWVAEVWFNQTVHRFTVVPGHALPGEWRVVSGNDKSLTLAKGKLIKTFYPPAMGSTGAEFAHIQKTLASEASVIEFARNVQAISAPLPSFEPNPGAAEPARPAPANNLGANPAPKPTTNSNPIEAASQLPRNRN